MPHRPVRQLMHAVVATLRPDQTAREAEQLLARHRVSGAPVVDAKGHLVGVVSQSDLVRLDARRPSVAAAGAFFTDVEEYRELAAVPADESLVRVEQIMTRNVLSVAPDAPLTEAAERMRRHRVHRLLVTEDGALRGIVSALDLLLALEQSGKTAK
jgi:CBS domain-containing protein